MGWIKAIFGAVGAVFGWLSERQLIKAGEERANNEATRKSLALIAKARAPISDADRKRVWDRITAKFGSKPGVPDDPGT